MSKYIKQIEVNNNGRVERYDLCDPQIYKALDLTTLELNGIKSDIYENLDDTGYIIISSPGSNIPLLKVHPDDLGNYPTYFAIGIVVIPSSHNVYGTGECGVIALENMAPFDGRGGHSNTYGSTSVWGAHNGLYGLPLRVGFVSLGSSDNPTSSIGTSYYISSALFPQNGTYTYQNPQDTNTGYTRPGYIALPSPYLTDNSRNKDYYYSTGVLDEFVLANIDEQKSRDTILKSFLSGSYPNSDNLSGYPAIKWCDEYTRGSLGKGEWYLPSIGELGYLSARKEKIKYAIEKINQRGTSVVNYYNYILWSTTVLPNGVYTFSDGLVSILSPSNYNVSVPFTRLRLLPTKFYTKDEVDSKFYTKEESDSKYLTEHQDLSEIESTLNTLESNVSNIENDIYDNNVELNIGDIILVDNETKELISCNSNVDNIHQYKDTHTPIGVVVIPSSHDVYNTGEAAMVSLNYMDYNTPNNGGEGISMCWGPSNILDSSNVYGLYSLYRDFPQLDLYLSENPKVIGGCSSIPYFSSDKFGNYISGQDPFAGYYIVSSPNTPSPYLKDNSRNPLYYSTNIVSNNCLSYFDGKALSEKAWIKADDLNNGWRTNTQPVTVYATPDIKINIDGLTVTVEGNKGDTAIFKCECVNCAQEDCICECNTCDNCKTIIYTLVLDGVNILTFEPEEDSDSKSHIMAINVVDTGIISNVPDNYPAFCCCWRYFTECTKQGDWYLPSMGELGYMMSRFDTLNAAIFNILAVWNIGITIDSNSYWSTSENTDYSAWGMNMNSGSVSNYRKLNSYYTRAFCRIKIEKSNIKFYTKQEATSKIKESVSILEKDIYEDFSNGYEYVDMGEAGIWAKYPIGVTNWKNCYDDILYFLWGDIKGYTKKQVGIEKQFNGQYTDYRFSDGGASSVIHLNFTKYCDLEYYGKDGYIDNLTQLESEDDAAVQLMRGKWRMPTQSLWQKLYDLCDRRWTDNYNGTGVKGKIFTLKTDSSKKWFFPAVGYAYNGLIGLYDSTCALWSSSLVPQKPSDAYSCLALKSAYLETTTHYLSRYFGMPIVGFIPTDTVKETKFYTKQEVDEIKLELSKFNTKLSWKILSCPPPTMVTLDQSVSDPTQMVTGSLGKDGTPQNNVVTWIRSKSHRYVGNYDPEKGMILKLLDDNDSTKYADGTDASKDITGANGGDVFMKMPNFWFRGESLDDTNDKYNIYFSAVEPNDDNNWTKWDGNTLIGVYKATAENTENNTNGALFSKSGVEPTVSVSQANFKAKARNRSNGDDHFMIVTYEAHQVMALLYIAYYGNMNAQTVIGSGISLSYKVVGQTNVDGMHDTVANNTKSINFWGLEDWWGGRYESIDNLVTKDGSGTININNYDGGAERQVKSYYSPYNSSITKMVLGERLDLIPSALDGTYTSYYCDVGMIGTSAGLICNRASSNDSGSTGPFYFHMSATPSLTVNTGSTRLLYNGRVIITP